MPVHPFRSRSTVHEWRSCRFLNARQYCVFCIPFSQLHIQNRDLIKSLESRGKLKGLICRVVRQNNRGRPATEFWLNRTQVLKIATQSETERADELTDLIIAVFEKVLDGWRVAPANDNSSSLEQIVHVLVQLQQGQQKLTDRMLDLENRIKAGVHSEVMLGRERARKILNRVKSIATMYEVSKTKAWSKRRSTIEHQLRKRCGVAMGQRWEDAPVFVEREAKVYLDELETEARKHQPKQTVIPTLN